jgi:transposase
MARVILDDALWGVIAPHLPVKRRRRRYPGRKPKDNRAVLTGILFVLKTGIPWEDLPREMGCTGMTCWRRLRDWQRAGVWDTVHRTLLNKLRGADKIDFSRAVVDSSSVRAVLGGRKRAPIARTAGRRGRSIISLPTRTAFRWQPPSPVRIATM